MDRFREGLPLIACVNKLLLCMNTDGACQCRQSNREKLAEVTRTTQSASLRRLMQMIDTMDFEDWVVYALKIMTEDNASLRRD